MSSTADIVNGLRQEKSEALLVTRESSINDDVGKLLRA